MLRPDFAGLAYHERTALLRAEGATLTVYVPAEPLGWLAPRSGIVGEPLGDDHTLIHYEGWINGAMQYEALPPRGQWEAAVQHAAGRAFVAYPTIARRSVVTMALHEVGTVSVAGSLDIHDEGAVDAWLRTT